jgi:hypothetical protein
VLGYDVEATRRTFRAHHWQHDPERTQPRVGITR